MELRQMSFDEALKILNIEDYKEKIMNSNSHGELSHLMDYIALAQLNENNPEKHLFRPWFETVVKYANKNWGRPESIYQWIFKVFHDHMRDAYDRVTKEQIQTQPQCN